MPHFTEKETEAESSQISCLKPFRTRKQMSASGAQSCCPGISKHRKEMAPGRFDHHPGPGNEHKRYKKDAQ